MRKSCGEVVQFMCAPGGISRGVIPLYNLLLFFVGTNTWLVRSLYKFFTSGVHNYYQTFTDEFFSYTHNTQALKLKKLSLNKLFT